MRIKDGRRLVREALMASHALLVVLLLGSTATLAAPATGAAATATVVPSIAFGQNLLSDPPVCCNKATAASRAQSAVPELVKPEPSASENSEPNEYVSLGRHSIKISDGLLVLFTAMLAAFTFGLWVSTRALWKETQRGGKTAEIAANAAEKSALAAETSANASLLSVEASMAAQQPRWLIHDVYLFTQQNHPLLAFPTLSVFVTLANVGSTAAEVTRTVLQYSVATILPVVPDYTREADRMHLIGTVKNASELGNIVNPGEHHTFTEYVNVSDEELADLETGARQLYVFGTVQYRDFLDRVWEKGFVAQLNGQRATLRVGDALGQGVRSEFVQPPPEANAERYTFTRQVAPSP
jgi:hypothetical protein